MTIYAVSKITYKKNVNKLLKSHKEDNGISSIKLIFHRNFSLVEAIKDEALDYRCILVTEATKIAFVCVLKSLEKRFDTVSIFVGNTGVKGSTHAEMRNKLFNLITVSLATSVLLAPSQKSLAQSLDYHKNKQEVQLLLSETGSTSGTKPEWIQGQRLVEEGKATLRTQSQSVTATTQPTQSDQLSWTQTSDWIESTPVGLFLTSMLVGYILTRLWFKKYRVHRATLLVQQIEMLERIWRMES